MDRKAMGWVKIVGAVVAGYLWYVQSTYAVPVLALVFLVAGVNSVMDKKKR